MKYSLIATWNMSLNGMIKANEILKNKGSLKDALISGINDVENNPLFHSVGYGGLPDKEGNCTYDAAYMNGDNLKFGAVGALSGIKNVVNVAELLSHEDLNNFLVGQGALNYALEKGFKQEEMLTKEAYEIYLEQLKKQNKLDSYHDTVCYIGMLDGHMATATSTSGLFMKHPGRIGDSPICGAGYYCDSQVGGCCATGVGEDVARSLLSYRCVSLLKDGLMVKEAVQKTLKEFEERISGLRSISLIAMDKFGNTAIATNTDFAYTIASSEIEPIAIQVRISNNQNTID